MTPDQYAALAKHCPEAATVIDAAEDVAKKTRKLLKAIARNADGPYLETLRDDEDKAVVFLTSAVEKMQAVTAA